MESWTLQVSRELVKLGHEVVVYTYRTDRHETDEVIDGIKVRRFGPRMLSPMFRSLEPYPYLPRVLSLSLWLPRALMQDWFDALFVSYVPLVFIGPLNRFLRARVWAVFHGFYDFTSALASKGHFRGLVGFLTENLALRMPIEGLVVVGDEVRRSLMNRGISGDKILLIRGGVDISEINSVQAQKTEHPQICFISRLVPERRLDDLLRAFAQVRNTVPESKLVIIGDGPMRKKWQELAHSIGLRGSVEFAGALQGASKVKVLKESHLMVHPSLREGMSLSVFEALACATPVIAYDIPEIREQIKLTNGGVLVPPRDIAALSSAIINMIQNPSARDELSKRGKAAVDAGFSSEIVAHKLLEIASRESPSRRHRLRRESVT